MGGQTNSKALLIGNGNNTKAINRSIKGRASIEKKRQKKFQQANEFSSLSPDAGQDLNIIAGDDYFTQKAKLAKQAKNRKFEQAKLTAEQRAFQSTRGAAQPFLVVQVRI